MQLQGSLRGNSVAQADSIIAALNESMKTMARELNAIDVDEEYFRDREIRLADWLKGMNATYAATYSSVGLEVSGDVEITLWASDYMLTLVFWNLWIDAHQVTGPSCKIDIDIRKTFSKVIVIVGDNGDGFPEKMMDIAFQERFSTKSRNRGRGLLEVQHAVSTLGGSVALFERKRGDRRIQIVLPVYAGR